jgi:hypothetical protein
MPTVRLARTGDFGMAMINCSECGKEISDKAVACPSCGCPIGSARETLNNPNDKSSDAFREYSLQLSNFWEKQIGKFRVYEDRIVFSKLDYIMGAFPKQTREYSLLISAMSGISIKNPSKLTIALRKIQAVVVCVVAALIAVTLIIAYGAPALFSLIILAYLVFKTLFNIKEASNIQLLIDTPKLAWVDRTINVAASDYENLKLFADEINNARARDINYITRNKGTSEHFGFLSS